MVIFQKQLNKLRKSIDEDPEFKITEFFFSMRLEAQPWEKKVKHPQLRLYNWEKNIEDHTQFFEQEMVLDDYNDLFKCRLFAYTFYKASILRYNLYLFSFPGSRKPPAWHPHFLL